MLQNEHVLTVKGGVIQKLRGHIAFAVYRKERIMDIQEILKHSDELLQEGRSREAAEFLKGKTSQARAAGEWEAELSMINELMGYYRSISRLEHAWEYARRAAEIVNGHGMESTAEGMTTCLNVANVYRASGKTKEAMELYRRVEQTYGKLGIAEDYRLGGLYNNMSVAHLELGELDEAARYGEKAVQILGKIPGAEDECATVYGNLAGAMLNGNRPDLKKAEEYTDAAMRLFETACKDSPHYPGAVAMKAYIAYLKKDTENALALYKKAMEETEKHYGRNADYERLERNYTMIKKMEEKS